MRALSLTQPWPWIVLNLGKRCENRPRNLGKYRGPLLLHAALRMTEDEWDSAFWFVVHRFGSELAAKIPLWDSPELVRGSIVGCCMVVNQCEPGAFWSDGLLRHEPADWKDDQERWYMGNHAYIFEQVAHTRHVACKGALGFWRPPPAVAWHAVMKEGDLSWLALSDAERMSFIAQHDLMKGLAA